MDASQTEGDRALFPAAALFRSLMSSPCYSCWDPESTSNANLPVTDLSKAILNALETGTLLWTSVTDRYEEYWCQSNEEIGEILKSFQT